LTGRFGIHWEDDMKTKVCLTFLAVSLVAASNAEGTTPQTSLWIETSELAGRLSDPNLRIIDARPPNDYKQAHIPGAVNLPAPSTDSLEANAMGYPIPPERAEELFRAAGINQSSQIVVYDSQGHRFAARIFYVLEFFGHPRVAVLNGGFPKWQSEGRLLTPEEPKVASGDFKPDTRSSVIATADWVKQNLNKPGVKLVDARSPEEYAGSSAQGARSGHIPGAVNLEWKRLLNPGDVPTLFEIPELQRLFAGAGVEPTQEVVAYCQSGTRASLIYFALRLLGYPRVRMYDGSWSEWSSSADLPIEK
jgi:thiosulfate/3-mercaptopyruvate sulfurtransferase